MAQFEAAKQPEQLLQQLQPLHEPDNREPDNLEPENGTEAGDDEKGIEDLPADKVIRNFGLLKHICYFTEITLTQFIKIFVLGCFSSCVCFARTNSLFLCLTIFCCCVISMNLDI